MSAIKPRYEILTAPNHYELVSKVNEFIDGRGEVWEPTGGVFVYLGTYLQAMRVDSAARASRNRREDGSTN